MIKKFDTFQSNLSNPMEKNTLELNLSKKQMLFLYMLIGLFFLLSNTICLFLPFSNDDPVYMGAIKMVLEGKIPYRDFVWGTTPGFLYMNALIASIFSLDLIPLRLLGFVFGLAGLVLIGCISFRIGGHMGSLISITISATTFYNASAGIYFVPMANFFLITAIALQLFLKENYYKIFVTIQQKS